MGKKSIDLSESKEINYYKVLGLENYASIAAVKEAYESLRVKYNPEDNKHKIYADELPNKGIDWTAPFKRDK